MELSLDLPNDVRGGGKRRSGGNVSVGRSAPQVVPHSLTHSALIPKLAALVPKFWFSNFPVALLNVRCGFLKSVPEFQT